MEAISKTKEEAQVSIRARSTKNRFQRIAPLELIEMTDLMFFAYFCLRVSYLLEITKKIVSGLGRPKVYSDATIYATSIIQRLWQKSNEGIIQLLYDHPEIAVGLGYPLDLKTNTVSIIDPAHYGRRKKELGLIVYWIGFITLVKELMKEGIIKAKDLILDGSVLRSWFKKDPEGGYCKYKKVFGFKILMIIDRFSMLPMMFCVLPANRHDSFGAFLLLLMTYFTYHLVAVDVVRADSAFFDATIKWVIETIMGAKAFIDYNLRRKEKTFLVTLPFINAWKKELGIRATIERFFGIIKNHYGLKYFQTKGLQEVIRHSLLTCMAMLITASVANKIGKPHLMRSPNKLLTI